MGKGCQTKHSSKWGRDVKQNTKKKGGGRSNKTKNQKGEGCQTKHNIKKEREGRQKTKRNR